MPSNILTTGTTADENSADQVVAAGTNIIAALKGPAGVIASDCKVAVSIKDDTGFYNRVADMDSFSSPRAFYGPATYRFTRISGNCGVFGG